MKNKISLVESYFENTCYIVNSDFNLKCLVQCQTIYRKFLPYVQLGGLLSISFTIVNYKEKMDFQCNLLVNLKK